MTPKIDKEQHVGYKPLLWSAELSDALNGWNFHDAIVIPFGSHGHPALFHKLHAVKGVTVHNHKRKNGHIDIVIEPKDKAL
jgi:hypothetical protein